MRILKYIRNIDPRIIFILFFSGFFFDALVAGSKQKKLVQFIIALIVFLFFECVFSYIRFKKIKISKSSFVSPCGVFALISSPHLWPFALFSFLASYSKHFLRIKGHHIFNPVTFGFVLVRFYFPEFIDSGASTWSGQEFFIYYFWITGTILVLWAKRFFISYTFFSVLLLAHVIGKGIHPSLFVSPFYSPSFFLLCFFMISDPITSPSKITDQIIWGCLIGILAIFLKTKFLLSAGVLAIFIGNILFALIRQKRKQSDYVNYAIQ